MGAYAFYRSGAWIPAWAPMTCERVRLAVRNLAAASEPEKIPVCGIPRDKLDKYVSLLRHAGREVHLE